MGFIHQDKVTSVNIFASFFFIQFFPLSLFPPSFLISLLQGNNLRVKIQDKWDSIDKQTRKLGDRGWTTEFLTAYKE